MFKFEGRTAVISGGAEGIGFAIAKALGEQKMNIVLADIDEQSLLKSVEELESLGIPVLGALLDVADEMQWHSVAKQAKDKFGKVHMVVNNAGCWWRLRAIRKARNRRVAMGVRGKFDGSFLWGKNYNAANQGAW